MSTNSIVKDMGLAAAGNKKIDWVARHAPVLTRLRETYVHDGSLKGLRVGIAIPVDAKAAYFASVLADAGAWVAIAGTAPLSVQDDVAAGLVSRGVTVYASSAAPRDEFERNLERVLEFRPDAIIDDRAALVTMAHSMRQMRQDALAGIKGASEETTAGVTRLRAMERQGALTFPVVAANDARCRRLFDDRYGAGQSTLTAIMDTTNLFMAGKEIIVVGYGWRGKGLARRAKGLAARVTVAEIDPVKGLEAYADGFDIQPLDSCVERGDIFITSTGVRDTIDVRHVERMKDGVILVNAGGTAVAIDEAKLKGIAREQREARRHITEFVLPNDRRVHLIAHGLVVDLAAADGRPVESMDLTFSVQAMALRYVALNDERLEPRVYPFPAELDSELARLKLESLGMGVAALTPARADFLNSGA